MAGLISRTEVGQHRRNFSEDCGLTKGDLTYEQIETVIATGHF